MKLRTNRGLASSAIALALACLMAACGEPSEQEQIAAARASLDKKDEKTAIVHLKAAIQKNPKSGEVRFLLGRTLLKNGEAMAATVELEKARDAKFNDNELIPNLARAYLLSGQSKKVTDTLAAAALTDPKAASALKAVIASAFIVQGHVGSATAAVDAALQLDETNTNARLLKARLTAGLGEVDNAIVLVDALLRDDPRNPQAWNLKGELQWLGKADLAEGAKSFREALVIEPRFVQSHSSLVKLLLQKRDFEGAKNQVALMKVAAPDHPDTRFFVVQQALFEQDMKTARDGVQRLLHVAPDNPHVLQLAGAVELKGDAVLAAEAHLAKALAKMPNMPFARQLLTQVYLRSGQLPKAIATLQPLISVPKPSVEALALAGEVYMQAGDFVRAEQYYVLAASADPADTKVQTALALSQLAKGNVDVGFAQLESVAAKDSSTYADLALISARMRRSDSVAALKAIDKLQAKMPGKPIIDQLRGQVLTAKGDTAAAKASYEKALAVDPVYLPALSALAVFDLREDKPAQALKRYEAFLQREPKNVQAILAVANLRKSLGAKNEEVKGLVVDAVKANPTDPLPRVALVELLLALHDVKAALTAAQDGLAALPDSLGVMLGLGRAQLAAGDTQQAISTLRKIISIQPNFVQAHLRLADAYRASNDYSMAAQSLRKALEVSPKLLEAQRALIQIALVTKRRDEAFRIARVVQAERPLEAAGYILEAEIHLLQGAFDPAIAALRSALERQKIADIAMRLHDVYLKAGRIPESERFVTTWLKEQPQDVSLLFYLGSMAMDVKDYASAEARYRQVLAVLPDNPAALNNVAWLLARQGKPGALAFAERAVHLRPDQVPFIETMAYALAGEKRWDKAIDWQKKAVAAAPAVASYRLGLAKMLVEVGNKAAAKDELQKLRDLGSAFSGQAEVAALEKRL